MSLQHRHTRLEVVFSTDVRLGSLSRKRPLPLSIQGRRTRVDSYLGEEFLTTRRLMMFQPRGRSGSKLTVVYDAEGREVEVSWGA